MSDAKPLNREKISSALEAAKAALKHAVPYSCWATGPKTGDPYEDFVVCPGCRALRLIAEAEAVS